MTINDCKTVEEASVYMDGKIVERTAEIKAGRPASMVDALFLAVAGELHKAVVRRRGSAQMELAI